MCVALNGTSTNCHAYRKPRKWGHLFTIAMQDIYVARNITGEYAEWLRLEIMHRPYMNGYNSRRAGVISVSFGMQAQLE